MKLGTFFGLVFSLNVALATPVASAKSDLRIPDDVRLKGLNGGSLTSKELKGQKVVLQFFASWCQGCGEVMAELGPMLQKSHDVRFLPVSLDESMNDAKGYFKRQRAAIKPFEKLAYLDGETRLASALDVKALPAIVVLDENGRVLAQFTGHPGKKQLQKIKGLISDSNAH